MCLWKRLIGVGKKLCFWGLLAAVATGGLLELPTLDAVFLILGILLFGVPCAFLAPSPTSQATSNPG